VRKTTEFIDVSYYITSPIQNSKSSTPCSCGLGVSEVEVSSPNPYMDMISEFLRCLQARLCASVQSHNLYNCGSNRVYEYEQ